jgi:hypothetical protein
MNLFTEEVKTQIEKIPAHASVVRD